MLFHRRRPEVSIECSLHAEENTRTVTAKVYHGCVPADVAAGAALIDEKTNAVNAKQRLFLGNIIRSMKQQEHVVTKGEDTTDITLLGRSELDLLRFIPRQGGEISDVPFPPQQNVYIDKSFLDRLENVNLVLQRPPPLRFMQDNLYDSYCSCLQNAMKPVIAMYRDVMLLNENTAGRVATTFIDTTPAQTTCSTLQDVRRVFTIAMCLKFFYMWRFTTQYLKPVEDFLDCYEFSERVKNRCGKTNIDEALSNLTKDDINDSSFPEWNRLFDSIKNFIAVYKGYIENSKGLVTKVTSTIEDKHANPASALWAMYEDNEEVIYNVPVGCNRVSEGEFKVEWRSMQDLSDGQQHFRGMLTAMESDGNMTPEMENRLSGYIALAHSKSEPGAIHKLGQAIFGTMKEHGEVLSTTVFKESDNTFYQAATTTSVGTRDIGVVTWCASTAFDVSNIHRSIPKKEEEREQDTKEWKGLYDKEKTAFGSVVDMQKAVKELLDEMCNKIYDDKRVFQFARLYGLPGVLRGCVYGATSNKVYRVTTYDDTVKLLLPEPWIQKCFEDVAASKTRSIQKAPFMGVMSAIREEELRAIKEKGICHGWWLQHTNDPLTGLSTKWEQKQNSSQRGFMWLLLEDACSDRLFKV